MSIEVRRLTPVQFGHQLVPLCVKRIVDEQEIGVESPDRHPIAGSEYMGDLPVDDRRRCLVDVAGDDVDDGLTLYAHNFLSRTVTSHDISGLVENGVEAVTKTWTLDAVGSETLASDVLLGKQHFYDARDDPHERIDRAMDNPDELARLGAAADQYLELQPDWGEAPRREIGELELNHLRALGYAIE